MGASFSQLSSEEREAIDNYAFALSLLQKGGDAERRFCLICLDSSIEVILRAFLLSKGISREVVGDIRKLHELLKECESKGLALEKETKVAIYDVHEKRNMIYHGRSVMLPTRTDLEAWSSSIESLLINITSLDPTDYFRSKYYERVSIKPEDLEYVENLERRFKITPPYVKRLTWWSEVQRDAIEAAEKWDLYVHYRPRWPFFIPTLILVKCNPHEGPMQTKYALELESKAAFLKSEKKAWRTWLGLISSSGFEQQALTRAKDHEGKNIGFVLINPSVKKCYCSAQAQCGKAMKWLTLW